MVLIELTSHGIYSIINRINVTIVIVIMRAANKNNTRRLKLGGETGHAGAGQGGDQRRHHRPPGAPPLSLSLICRRRLKSSPSQNVNFGL